MTHDTISIDELEPLVEKIEAVASTLDTFLRECADFGFPPQDFCDDVADKLDDAPKLHKWLDELCRKENRYR